MRRFLIYVAVCIGMLALPGWALAGELTLHPSGFGEHSYAAWKAMEGQPDTRGNKDEALYFQKMTETTVFAAAFALLKAKKAAPSPT